MEALEAQLFGRGGGSLGWGVDSGSTVNGREFVDDGSSAVWVDDQENLELYSSKLRGAYEGKLGVDATWAREDDYVDLVRERVLQSTSLLQDGRKILPGKLPIQRTAILYKPDIAHSISTQSIQFSPNQDYVVTCGLDKRLMILTCDDHQTGNFIKASYLIPDFPMTQASFSKRTPDEVLCFGKRKWFYVLNVETGDKTKISGIIGRNEKTYQKFDVSYDGSLIAVQGDEGAVLLLSGITKQMIKEILIGSHIQDIRFRPNGQLVVSGSDGLIRSFDSRNLSLPVETYETEDLGDCPLGILGNSSLAAGSSSGIVNLWTLKNSPPRAIMSLTTPTTAMAVHPSFGIFAVASNLKKDQLRMIHVDSGTVFSNWPTSSTPLKYVTSMAFSDKQFCVGNDKGIVSLYTLENS